MAASPKAPAPAPDTRTGPLVQKLVDGVKEDLADFAAHIQKGRDLAKAMEGTTRGINGLAATLKAWCNTLDKMIEDARTEADGVERKMLGQSVAHPITERVAHQEPEPPSGPRAA